MLDDTKRMKKFFIQCIAVAGLALVVFFVWYANIYREKQSLLEFKSRYTFAVHIDSEGDVLGEKTETMLNENEPITVTQSLGIDQIAHIWIKEFTGQYTKRFVARSQALRNVEITEITVLDESENVVMISFSAELKNLESEYFSSWDGISDNGKMLCEWVVKFDVDELGDNTANVYADTIQSSEEYGIAAYNASLKNQNETKVADNSSLAQLDKEKSLCIYEIKNQVLSVSYDGGEKFITVPVDFDNLMSGQQDKGKLALGSYLIGSEKTAFLYGGTVVNNKNVPLTLIFSSDKGSNWISAQISDVTGLNYYYTNFWDKTNGIIVIGYDKTSTQESSIIYITMDGGENWNKLGSGPTTNIINGVNYIDENLGFFSYEYVDGMDSNLYVTRDGGKTFSKITLDAQQLDSTATNKNNSTTKLEWTDVFKEAQVPTRDSNGNLNLYVTQGTDGSYNGGNTVAKYQSTDNGLTWNYIEQLEKEVLTTIK